jgi:hypothetical protein
VRSYKEETAAQNDRNRLRDKDIDAYILKTYDDQQLFSFDLHAGAFETTEEALELSRQLAEMGIDDTEVADYNEIKPKLDKYNEVVGNEDVTLRKGLTDIPTTFSSFVHDNLRQFPINYDFSLKELHIYDLDNYRKHERTSGAVCLADLLLAEGQAYHCYTSALYHDNLLNNDILIQIAVGDPGSIRDEINMLPVKFAIPNGEISCIIDMTNDTMSLIGTDQSRSIGVVMVSSDFDADQIISFINNLDNDSNLLIFPEVRRNLLVLPNVNDDVERDLMHFSLKQTDDSYADDRGYVDWSVAIVGHWEACGYFMQDDEMQSVSFFDLDYDYNAEHVHRLFMKDHSASLVNDDNHPITVNDVSGWYHSNEEGHELSFSKNSHIISIDSVSLEETDLSVIAEDLRIWDPPRTAGSSPTQDAIVGEVP